MKWQENYFSHVIYYRILKCAYAHTNTYCICTCIYEKIRHILCIYQDFRNIARVMAILNKVKKY